MSTNYTSGLVIPRLADPRPGGSASGREAPSRGAERSGVEQESKGNFAPPVAGAKLPSTRHRGSRPPQGPSGGRGRRGPGHTGVSSRGRIRTFVDGSKVRCPAWLDDPGSSNPTLPKTRPRPRPSPGPPSMIGRIGAGAGESLVIASVSWAKVNLRQISGLSPCLTYDLVGYGYVSVKHAVSDPQASGP